MSEFEMLVKEARDSAEYWKGMNDLAEERYKFVQQENEKLLARIGELELKLADATLNKD